MASKYWIGVLVLSCAFSPAQETAKSLLEAAEKRVASAKGKMGEELDVALKDAALLFETVSKKFPAAKAECARADLGLGRAQKRRSDFVAAEAAWKRAAASGETRPAAEALHDLATLYRKQKRLPEAQNALERVISEFASEPRERAEALVRLGGLHRFQKRPADAEDAWRRALSEHGELLTPALDALEDLVAMKVDSGSDAEAAEILSAQGEALKARFVGSRQEARLMTALDRIQLRLKKAERTPKEEPKTP